MLKKSQPPRPGFAVDIALETGPPVARNPKRISEKGRQGRKPFAGPGSVIFVGQKAFELLVQHFERFPNIPPQGTFPTKVV